MKKIIFLLLPPLFFYSCSSLPFDLSQNSKWAGMIENARGSIKIISVSAERSGEWNALKNEITDLLPLFFSGESFRVVSSSVAADYSAEVKAREREYTDGWRTKRSLSVEVRIWEGDENAPLPLSTGRSLIQGKQTLSSSRTLSAMLGKAVKNAIRALPESAGISRGRSFSREAK